MSVHIETCSNLLRSKCVSYGCLCGNIGKVPDQLSGYGVDQDLAHQMPTKLVTQPFIRAASRMEQANAPTFAYHQQMKRELPVTCCTECGGAGYNIRVANARCCKTSGEQRCSGINAIAIKTDWIECAHCQATGYYRNKECPNCKGAGYLFVGLKDKATTSESVTFR
jgi:hypothetical protein